MRCFYENPNQTVHPLQACEWTTINSLYLSHYAAYMRLDSLLHLTKLFPDFGSSIIFYMLLSKNTVMSFDLLVFIAFTVAASTLSFFTFYSFFFSTQSILYFANGSFAYKSTNYLSLSPKTPGYLQLPMYLTANDLGRPSLY